MYTMEELVPIVGWLAEKYCAGESSSVTYEKAEQLMGAVLYCIHEVTKGKETQKEQKKKSEKGQKQAEVVMAGRAERMSAQQAYETGAKLVKEKTKRTLEMYNQMLPEFNWYGNQCLHDTVVKGLPEFFKWYDCLLEPQNTILTLDYPVITDLSACTGIDRISAFLECVRLEQRFLGRFPQGYVRTVLREHTSMYMEMIENLCEVVLLSVLKHMLAKKPLTEPGLEKDDHLRIQSICGQTDTAGLRQLLEEAVEALCVEYFEGDAGLCAYLQCAVADMAVRLKADSLY